MSHAAFRTLPTLQVTFDIQQLKKLQTPHPESNLLKHFSVRLRARQVPGIKYSQRLRHVMSITFFHQFESIHAWEFPWLLTEVLSPISQLFLSGTEIGKLWKACKHFPFLREKKGTGGEFKMFPENVISFLVFATTMNKCKLDILSRLRPKMSVFPFVSDQDCEQNSFSPIGMFLQMGKPAWRDWLLKHPSPTPKTDHRKSSNLWRIQTLCFLNLSSYEGSNQRQFWTAGFLMWLYTDFATPELLGIHTPEILR